MPGTPEEGDMNQMTSRHRIRNSRPVSKTEHANSRSRSFPTILYLTSELGRLYFYETWISELQKDEMETTPSLDFTFVVIKKVVFIARPTRISPSESKTKTIQSYQMSSFVWVDLSGGGDISLSVMILSATWPILLDSLILITWCEVGTVQSQTTVSDYFWNKQLLLFVFELHGSLLPSSTGILTAVQRKTSVTAHLTSKQLLLFVFELHDSLLPSSTGILTAVQRKTAVTAYFSSKQLLLFVFELQDSLLPSCTGILSAVQRQTAVTAHLKSQRSLLFAVARL